MGGAPRMGSRTPRRTIALIVVIPVTALIAIVAWGFASPIGSAPDDDYHMASIWCAVGDRAGLCEPGSDAVHRRVPARLIESSPCYKFRPDVSGRCSTELSERLVNSKRGNFDHTYPPVFYASMGIFASTAIDTSILVMRTVNAALFVGMMTVLFLLLRPERRPMLIWGSVAALVPLGMFLIPSVNPSSWAITSAAVLWGALIGFVDETARRRRIAFAVFAVLGILMAAGARSDAAVYSGVAIVAACVVSFRPTRAWARGLILPAVGVVVAVVFFFASGQSAVVDPGTSTSTPDLSLGYVLQEDLVRLPGLWAGALGTWALGWFDTPMPALVWVPAVTLFFALVVWGLRVIDRRKAIALAVVTFALIAVPMYILLHDRVLIGTMVQPRYVYPLMILLLGVAMYGLARGDLGLTRPQLVIVAGALALADGTALHTNLRRYVTGLDEGGANLDHGREWWWHLPFGPDAVWVVGTVAFSAALVGLLALAWRPDGGVDRSGPARSDRHA